MDEEERGGVRSARGTLWDQVTRGEAADSAAANREAEPWAEPEPREGVPLVDECTLHFWLHIVHPALQPIRGGTWVITNVGFQLRGETDWKAHCG